MAAFAELQEKLRKRREVVEEEGLLFESQPSGKTVDGEVCDESAKTRPVSSSVSAADFQAALSRRRATVDDDGQTFESSPTGKKADVTAKTEQSGGVPRLSTAGRIHRGGSTDFREAIDKQRASVDDGCQTFESKPSASLADCCHGGVQAPSNASPIVSRANSASLGSSSQTREVAPAETLASQMTEFSLADDRKGGDSLDAGAADVPTPSRSCNLARAAEMEEVQPEQAEESEQVFEAEMATEEMLEEAVREQELKTILTSETKTGVFGRTIWKVPLNGEEFVDIESPSFAIGKYEDLVLKLRSSEPNKNGHRGCELSVHGPSPRLGSIKARLFAGQGWGKAYKALSDWRDGQPCFELYDIDLSGRKTLLCGLAFHVDK